MKPIARLTVAAVFAIAAGLTAEAAAPPAPAPAGSVPQPVDVPLKAGSVVMTAPAGAIAKASFGTTYDITAGRPFQLELSVGPGALAKIKQEIQANTFNVFKRYVIDESNGIVYETALAGASEYHLYAVIPGVLGGLVCENTKGPAYTEAQARTMYASCKSVALKP